MISIKGMEERGGRRLTLATCIFPQRLLICPRSCLTSSGRMGISESPWCFGYIVTYAGLQSPPPLPNSWQSGTCELGKKFPAVVVPTIHRHDNGEREQILTYCHFQHEPGGSIFQRIGGEVVGDLRIFQRFGRHRQPVARILEGHFFRGALSTRISRNHIFPCRVV